MKVILDSAVFINATSFPFSKKDEYIVTSACEGEMKEMTAKMRLEAAFQEGKLSITDPCPASLQIAQSLARKYGVKRLSDADESIFALALEIADRKEKLCVYTDDYSLQNLLKHRKIPFSGVLQKGIVRAKAFKTTQK